MPKETKELYTENQKTLMKEIWASLVAQSVKNLPAVQETQVQSLGWEDCLDPLQYSCLENPMDRGDWWATVHGVTKSRTQLSNLTLIILLL